MIGGRVGSLFGLNPYSSTSFLRSSSAAFFAFHFLQKYKAAKMIMATEATGTTTATAIVPPAESPEPPPALVLVADADDPVAVADMLLAEFPVV
jgi:hypothetical protein